MSSSNLNFATGKFNSETKVFTAADGTQYYISSDSCGSESLSQSCNTGYCSWGDWQDDAVNGKASCPAPCSSYVYKQNSLCPGGNCDATKSDNRYKFVKCGELPCATKTLGGFGECSASCGGGSQSRGCSINPLPNQYEESLKIQEPIHLMATSKFSNRPIYNNGVAINRVTGEPSFFTPGLTHSALTQNTSAGQGYYVNHNTGEPNYFTNRRYNGILDPFDNPDSRFH
jgi:hypothetical protein